MNQNDFMYEIALEFNMAGDDVNKRIDCAKRWNKERRHLASTFSSKCLDKGWLTSSQLLSFYGYILDNDD